MKVESPKIKASETPPGTYTDEQLEAIRRGLADAREAQVKAKLEKLDRILEEQDEAFKKYASGEIDQEEFEDRLEEVNRDIESLSDGGSGYEDSSPAIDGPSINENSPVEVEQLSLADLPVDVESIVNFV